MSDYLEASIKRDVCAVYEPTTSPRRDAGVNRAYSTSKVIREFFADNTTLELEQLSNNSRLARFYVTGETPDFYSVAMKRALEGIELDTQADWATFVDVMQAQDFDTVTNQEEFYMICESQHWLVLEPPPF